MKSKFVLDKSLWRPSFTYVVHPHWGDAYLATIRQGTRAIYHQGYYYKTKAQAIEAARLTIPNLDPNKPIPFADIYQRRVRSWSNSY